jgi:hypothetical protein
MCVWHFSKKSCLQITTVKGKKIKLLFLTMYVITPQLLLAIIRKSKEGVWGVSDLQLKEGTHFGEESAKGKDTKDGGE